MEQNGAIAQRNITVKINYRDLNILFSLAKTEMNKDAHRGLDSQETLAKVWLLAVSQFLGQSTEYEFPNERQVPVPDDED